MAPDRRNPDERAIGWRQRIATGGMAERALRATERRPPLALKEPVTLTTSFSCNNARVV
jgi:hypothetical protein